MLPFYFCIGHPIFVYFDLPNFGENKFEGIFISEHYKNHLKEVQVIWIFVFVIISLVSI